MFGVALQTVVTSQRVNEGNNHADTAMYPTSTVNFYQHPRSLVHGVPNLCSSDDTSKGAIVFVPKHGVSEDVFAQFSVQACERITHLFGRRRDGSTINANSSRVRTVRIADDFDAV